MLPLPHAIRANQEQRKTWEEHRRRSVYLDEQAAAAEKAASEASRRHSHLYMSTAQQNQPTQWTNSPHYAAHNVHYQQQYHPYNVQGRPSSHYFNGAGMNTYSSILPTQATPPTSISTPYRSKQ